MGSLQGVTLVGTETHILSRISLTLLVINLALFISSSVNQRTIRKSKLATQRQLNSIAFNSSSFKGGIPRDVFANWTRRTTIVTAYFGESCYPLCGRRHPYPITRFNKSEPNRPSDIRTSS